MSHFSHMLRKLAGQAQLIVALVTLALAALAVGMWLYLSTRPAEPQAALPLTAPPTVTRSEEHTSELQSQFHLVCRLLLEKKKERSDE